ncbi:MAG TPA: GFA family protein [Geminicoccus sp.]|uniref:GFA family protein n=1 Tax=Geminicoccus sp. TaxID=2024832 RepID=UPI002E3200C8|nr:GFA family protein [Geminicoccus sp.]HEX2529560.1 GFA family protein [Geminicoccus sp.]
MTSGTWEGGCLCGAVRYRFTGELRELLYCHCRMCQRAGGTPVVAWMTLSTSGLQWTGRPPASYQSSASARRFFCAACGSPLAFQADDEPDQIDLTIASLDDPARAAPTYHAWVSSRLPWFETSDDLPRHEQASAT